MLLLLLVVFVLIVSILRLWLIRNDLLLEIIIQENTWKKFYVWDNDEVILVAVGLVVLFVRVCGGLFCNERSFTHLSSLTQVSAKEGFSERLAKQAFSQEQKACVKVYDGNILQCILQIIELALWKENFKMI